MRDTTNDTDHPSVANSPPALDELAQVVGDVTLVERVVSLSQLYVDPNNYRLDRGGLAAEYPDSQIPDLQEATLERLEQERLEELKHSILENGFLEVDRIVVRPLGKSSNKFVVVEGNRRTAALQGRVQLSG